ncbi:MAG TPA: hypothetical protein VL856_03635 [Acidimicrobiia bacterium]|nr:hypothetical protein [Acidimicrobiia bacterium]
MQRTESLNTTEVPGGGIALGIVVAAWLATIVLYLSHSIVLSSDSINNHVHVWWIARELWHHGHLPWRFAQLGHRDGYAYPYGFVNWTTAALVWPLFGDWAVTLWTVVGTVGCALATFVAFPELRRGWWAAAVLLNSALIEALLFGQQSFVWAAMLLLFGIAAWRSGRRGVAALLVGFAQLTHPVVVGPIALVVVLLYLPFTRERVALIKWYALACVIALPAVFVVLASPAYADAGSQVVNFFGTIGPRVLIVVLPMFYAVLRRTKRPWLGPAACVLSLGFSLGFQAPLNVRMQQDALVHHGADTTTLDGYLASPDFHPALTYRVLRGGDGKLGLYKVVRAGGHIDSELFPESMGMHNFANAQAYLRFLCERDVDRVLHFNVYDRRGTNEGALLDELVATSDSPIRMVWQGPDFQVYAVNRAACA